MAGRMKQPEATGGKWDPLESGSSLADPQPVATYGNGFAAW